VVATHALIKAGRKISSRLAKENDERREKKKREY